MTETFKVAGKYVPPELGIDNPMWDQLRSSVHESTDWGFGRSSAMGVGRPTGLEIGGLTSRILDHASTPADSEYREMGSWLQRRNDYVSRYAWTVTDPWTVEFVARWSGGRIIDPMAGTGYWAFLLGQLHVEVLASDVTPPAAHLDHNGWHPHVDSFVRMRRMDAIQAVKEHGEGHTLLLAWPPMSDHGYETVLAYSDDRVIHIGELGGCTGDEQLVGELTDNWTQVDWHPPVQFWGIHDVVTVWQRNGTEMPEPRSKDDQTEHQNEE